ncbi:MAG TPA: hypothetical protein VEC99_14050 [Clostridia bacterium]|nr:hypothetical protein [Clostridia bacterium]
MASIICTSNNRLTPKRQCQTRFRAIQLGCSEDSCNGTDLAFTGALQVMDLEGWNSSPAGASLEVLLDGAPVAVPPQRRSLAAILTYLEMLAMERQRILCSFTVDGQPLSLSQYVGIEKPFFRIEGVTIDLAQMPLQLVKTARQQTTDTKAQVTAAITQVLINTADKAREQWWNLIQELKQPLLTLSLMPARSSGGPGASIAQLRKWQLQQLATIIKDVDESCWSEDPIALSNALEHRVLPWLCGLQASLELWHETLLLGQHTVAIPEAE